MTIGAKEIVSLSINQNNCEELEQKILDLLNENKLNLRELVYVLGQLFIDVGGSIEGIQNKLNHDSIVKRYAVEPTLGNGLMALGSDVIYDWIKILENGEE